MTAPLAQPTRAPLTSEPNLIAQIIPIRFLVSPELLSIARLCALKISLSPEDAEDCALAFVDAILLDDSEAKLRPASQRHLTGTYCSAWVRRCALNHALKYRARLLRLAKRQRCWPEMQNEAGDVLARDVPDAMPGPERLLLKRAVWRTFQVILAEIAPEPRTIFVRHHDGESAAHITASVGRTVGAAEQSLARTRRRLRTRLEGEGITRADLVFVFAAPPLPNAEGY